MKALTVPILVVALAGSSFGLGVGDKAPALKVANVVKGKQVDLSKGVHVVEFWATWCGPCKTSIPHLTDMAKKFKGKVTFTGVSVWENGPDQLGQVKKFVDQMGPKMDYNVSFDGPSKFMATNWMTAARQNGIPAAFLVKDGVILSIRHPMDNLDKAIEEVLAGKFDVKKEKARIDAEQARQAEMEKQQEAYMAAMKPAMERRAAGDWPGFAEAMKKVAADVPAFADNTRFSAFSMLSNAGEANLAKGFANEVLSGAKQGDEMLLNQMAWMIVDPAGKVKSPDYATAEALALKAHELSGKSEPNIMDTYALALFRNGKKAEAIALQTKAVELLKKQKADAATMKEFEDRLAMFRKG